MAFGTKDKGREEENALKAQETANRATAEQATATAAAPDPLEAARRERVKALDDWEMGRSGPIDVNKMPGAGVALDLFRKAKTSTDAGRIGRGLGSLRSGANPNFSAALDTEADLERDQAARGDLEGYVNDTLEGNKAEMYGLAGMGNARNMSIAGMRNSSAESASDRRLRYLMRPKGPSFLRELAMNAAQGAGMAGAMAA